MPHDLDFSWGMTDEWLSCMAEGKPFGNEAAILGPDAEYQLHPSKLGGVFSLYAGHSTKQKRLADAMMGMLEANANTVNEKLIAVRGSRGILHHTHLLFKGCDTFNQILRRMREVLDAGNHSNIKSALAFQYHYATCVGCGRNKAAFLSTPAVGVHAPQFFLDPEQLDMEIEGWNDIIAYCADCKVRCVACKKNGAGPGMRASELRSFAAERLCMTCQSGLLASVKAPAFDRGMAKKLSKSKYILID